MNRKSQERLSIIFSTIMLVFGAIVISHYSITQKKARVLLKEEGIVDTCHVFKTNYIPKKGKSIRCAYIVRGKHYEAQAIDLDHFEHGHGVNISEGDTFLVRYAKTDPSINELILESYLDFHN